ncbi:MAG TPA: hypothetical protein VE153_17055, partial [Myxococcus sp.]|nr:hypothetical protein [Myxococcus sp.]
LETALEGAEASWEVPLCEAWAPDNATTRRETAPGDVAVAVNLERAVARGRRVSAYMREHPRRGGPAPTEPDAPEQSPGMDEPPVGEVEEPPARDTEREVAPAPVEPRARAASGYARAWRASMLALGVGAVLAAAYLHTVPAPSQVAAAPRVAPLPAQSATPVSWVAWVLSGQEVAPPWGPLEGGEGAVPAWAPTPAPVAFATLPEDSTRVKTSPKDSSPQQKKQGPVRNTVATAVCTATVGAVAAGCSGAQVRATPAPEACPAGSLEAMKQLGIHTGDETGAQFPGAEPGFVTVREGSGAQLVLGRPLGQLEAGTVLTGTLLFGKERVYGRFTEARRPGGATYSVCLEAWGIGGGTLVRGLDREPNGGPDTAKVTALPHVQAVERFE